MIDQAAVETTEKAGRRGRRCASGASAGGGSPVYGLGLIGAAVYYWRRADSPADRGLALLKALVWPAYLVYEAFAALHRAAEGNGD